MKLRLFNESWEKKKQLLACAGLFFGVITSGYVFLALHIFLLFTKFWWLVLPSFLWIYIDKDRGDKGGRPSNFIQNLEFWTVLKNYFRGNIYFSENCNFDLKKNYLMCCYPHGVLPKSFYINIIASKSGFNRKYPGFKRYVVTLKQMLLMPFGRECLMAMGFISSSKESLTYVLGKPEKGNLVVLYPGGALESSVAQPNTYKFVMRQRKGFAKIALQTGASLVPVVNFGETDLYDQVRWGWLKKFQDYFRWTFGFTPIIPIGRGLFQEYFGILPRAAKLITMVGCPTDVEKVENPTMEQIDNLHGQFLEEIIKLFEENKSKCLDDAHDIKLEIL